MTYTEVWGRPRALSNSKTQWMRQSCKRTLLEMDKSTAFPAQLECTVSQILKRTLFSEDRRMWCWRGWWASVRTTWRMVCVEACLGKIWRKVQMSQWSVCALPWRRLKPRTPSPTSRSPKMCTVILQELGVHTQQENGRLFTFPGSSGMQSWALCLVLVQHRLCHACYAQKLVGLYRWLTRSNSCQRRWLYWIGRSIQHYHSLQVIMCFFSGDDNQTVAIFIINGILVMLEGDLVIIHC